MNVNEKKVLKLVMAMIPVLLAEFEADPTLFREQWRAAGDIDLYWDSLAGIRHMEQEVGEAALKAAGIDTSVFGLKGITKQ